MTFVILTGDRPQRGQHSGAVHGPGGYVSDARLHHAYRGGDSGGGRRGCIGGALNGVVIARTRIQPFIVTLASMIGVRGLAKWLTSNSEHRYRVRQGSGGRIRRHLSGESDRDWRVCRGRGAVLGGAGADRFGRHVRAVGDNEKAAEYAGLPIRATKIWVYTLSGLFTGLAGVLYAAENHQGNPNAGVAYELDAIAAVVIGGTRLSGGQGSISGTIVGTLIMGVLTNMLRLNNVDSNVEMMIKAVIIVPGGRGATREEWKLIS